MKQLLLLSAISTLLTAQVFAGSTCKTCPTAPAQPKKEQTADATETKQNPEQDAMKQDAPKALLAANDTPAQQAPAAQDATQTQTDEQKQMQTKMLLAGGTSPTKADAVPAQEEKKADAKDAEKPVQQQLVA